MLIAMLNVRSWASSQ